MDENTPRPAQPAAETQNTTQDNAQADQQATKPAPRVVVGVDGSDCSLDALRRGVTVATSLGGTLEAVYAWRYPTSMGGYPMDGWSPEGDAAAALDAALGEVFGAERPDWVDAVLREGRPAHVLVEESDGAELLIVGSRGHGGFTGLLLGSVSSACAEYAKCPVLIMHKDDAAKTDGRAA
jgi:nucleotide-binding universal stress UspA family protein